MLTKIRANHNVIILELPSDAIKSAKCTGYFALFDRPDTVVRRWIVFFEQTTVFQFFLIRL